jgi:phage tail-like protein
VWPLPRFHFQVEWGSAVLSFQEVTGLDIEGEVAEYRHGDSPRFSTLSMPGLKGSSPVILKDGVFRSDTGFRDWFDGLTAKRVPVTIRLLDEEGSPTMVWTLANAWPTRITGTDLTSDGTEVTVETIEILHEGITIESA